MTVAYSWVISREPKLCSASGHAGNFSGVQRLHQIVVSTAPLPQAQRNHLSQLWPVGFPCGALGLSSFCVNSVPLLVVACWTGSVWTLTLLSCVLSKFILGLLPLPLLDLLLHSPIMQLALQLDSPDESCYQFLLHLAAEMLCFGNLCLILAWSCAKLLCACWAFVHILDFNPKPEEFGCRCFHTAQRRWNSLLVWNSFCCFWTTGQNFCTVHGNADPHHLIIWILLPCLLCSDGDILPFCIL